MPEWYTLEAAAMELGAIMWNSNIDPETRAGTCTFIFVDGELETDCELRPDPRAPNNMVHMVDMEQFKVGADR